MSNDDKLDRFADWLCSLESVAVADLAAMYTHYKASLCEDEANR